MTQLQENLPVEVIAGEHKGFKGVLWRKEPSNNTWLIAPYDPKVDAVNAQELDIIPVQSRPLTKAEKQVYRMAFVHAVADGNINPGNVAFFTVLKFRLGIRDHIACGSPDADSVNMWLEAMK